MDFFLFLRLVPLRDVLQDLGFRSCCDRYYILIYIFYMFRVGRPLPEAQHSRPARVIIINDSVVSMSSYHKYPLSSAQQQKRTRYPINFLLFHEIIIFLHPTRRRHLEGGQCHGSLPAGGRSPQKERIIDNNCFY